MLQRQHTRHKQDIKHNQNHIVNNKQPYRADQTTIPNGTDADPEDADTSEDDAYDAVNPISPQHHPSNRGPLIQDELP